MSVDIGEHSSSTVIMKYHDITMTFTNNVFNTIYLVLKQVDPTSTYKSPFGVHDIDLTVLQEEQLPSCLANQVMVNQKADVMKIEEVEELHDKPPELLEKVLEDHSLVQSLSEAGISDYGCLLILIERIIYRLNEHIKEYGTSYLWPDASHVEITTFSVKTRVHTGLCCFLHNILQNSFYILSGNYPSWVTGILHVIPEAFSFSERHDYLYVC